MSSGTVSIIILAVLLALVSGISGTLGLRKSRRRLQSANVTTGRVSVSGDSGKGDAHVNADDARPQVSGPESKGILPRLFIGSSNEYLYLVKLLHVKLDGKFQVIPWYDGVFLNGQATLADLIAQSHQVDFAALVMTPDDRRTRGLNESTDDKKAPTTHTSGPVSPETSAAFPQDQTPEVEVDVAGSSRARGSNTDPQFSENSQQGESGSLGLRLELASRDNVIFEAGLFIGTIGPGRTFLIRPDTSDFKVPSDLLGITGMLFDWPVGPDTDKVRRKIINHSKKKNRYRDININWEDLEDLLTTAPESPMKNRAQKAMREWSKEDIQKLNTLAEQIGIAFPHKTTDKDNLDIWDLAEEAGRDPLEIVLLWLALDEVCDRMAEHSERVQNSNELWIHHKMLAITKSYQDVNSYYASNQILPKEIRDLFHVQTRKKIDECLSFLMKAHTELPVYGAHDNDFLAKLILLAEKRQSSYFDKVRPDVMGVAHIKNVRWWRQERGKAYLRETARLIALGFKIQRVFFLPGYDDLLDSAPQGQSSNPGEETGKITKGDVTEAIWLNLDAKVEVYFYIPERNPSARLSPESWSFLLIPNPGILSLSEIGSPSLYSHPTVHTAPATIENYEHVFARLRDMSEHIKLKKLDEKENDLASIKKQLEQR